MARGDDRRQFQDENWRDEQPNRALCVDCGKRIELPFPCKWWREYRCEGCNVAKQKRDEDARNKGGK